MKTLFKELDVVAARHRAPINRGAHAINSKLGCRCACHKKGESHESFDGTHGFQVVHPNVITKEKYHDE